ncbi:TetR/AcrR family transcriptional regulator [Agreia sp. COWG]|uniref:TetR/AcrR family transcriptional regulator n=1 Tax=Agreia sp. COWG TaxID=2773266 RepID=UPI0019254B68|nr:TetR/AcrR family transcriptional regulator [Agreia sp. COWG]CAD6011003.1 HTH tetR-type domain-containing protein [Agreia sp. COWG]
MPRRVELREATRGRVLAAADDLFRERGFGATTIRDIAEASGFSVGSVMACGDKNALLTQVFDSLIETGHAQPVDMRGVASRPVASGPVASGPAAAQPGERECATRILHLVQPFVALFASRPDLSRVYASIQVAATQTSPLFTRLAELLVTEIGSALTEHGCSEPDAVAGTAQAIYFAYIGTLFSWPAQKPIVEADILASLLVTFTSICVCSEHTS